jgi:hypothetical protein
MLKQLSKWLGALLVAEAGVWLAWKQVAVGLPWWSQWAVLGVVALGFLLGLPVGRTDDGSPRRLVRVLVRGRGNAASFVSTGKESHITGNITNTGKGTQTIHGLPVTLTS